jgi:acetyltransferase-like isoleucine patch superfamily enzyme
MVRKKTKFKNVIIYPNVILGKRAKIEEFCVIGKPPRGKKPGELPTVIGDDAVIRSFTTIYSGNKIGAGFQTGQGVSIREDNLIGDEVSIGTNSVLEFGNRIGQAVRIHSHCFLEMTEIGDHVFVGPGVVFTDDPHPAFCDHYKECLGGVKVRRMAKIGARVTLLPGITIGENSLIGAGSVVTGDIPADMVAVGNPAKVIKKITDLKCPKGFYQKPYDWYPYKNKKA